jgi:hypothetical protein
MCGLGEHWQQSKRRGSRINRHVHQACGPLKTTLQTGKCVFVELSKTLYASRRLIRDLVFLCLAVLVFNLSVRVHLLTLGVCVDPPGAAMCVAGATMPHTFLLLPSLALLIGLDQLAIT